MSRAAAGLALCAVLAACSQSVRGEDFRVDLFTKSGMREVVLSPGTAAIEICETGRRATCLVVRTGETARCVPDAAAVRCSVASSTRSFSRATAHADSVFRLDAAPREAGGGMRGVTVRTAEFRGAKGNLRAVATIDLETYVSGVLAGEAATFKSPAALQAMAVLARTWALGSRGRHRTAGYDFCSLTHCQFFRPPLAPGANAAIAPGAERTAGLVLMHQGKIIDAYYSAHCGGRTASAASVWPDRAAPYLRSALDPYCVRGEQASWERRVEWVDITRVVKEEMPSGLRGPVRDLLVHQKDDSGRASTLRLVSDSAQPIDANAFRYALNRRLGWNTLKSSLYTIHHVEGGLIFRGRGLGHGVGLCQAGAEQMGRMGIGFEQILAHYFPGTSVKGAAGDERPRVLSGEHFDLYFPRAEEPLAARALEILEAERGRLGARARILPNRITVRAHASAEAFVRATGQPGWVSGSNDGRSIDLQPLKVLESRGILRPTLHHELLHLVLHPLRARSVPDWYEEGMILYLTGEKVSPPPAGLASAGDASLAASRAKMEGAYASARARVAELAERRGENALWQVLQHPTPEDLKWFNEQR